MSILVTGGAGYIGSHVVRMLRERGDEVVVVDNLTSGSIARPLDAPIIELDIVADGATSALADVIAQHRVHAVVHLAARKQAGASVEHPAYYYKQNIGGLANLLTALEHSSVNRFVFSSSAAVYGQPELAVVDEDSPTRPTNPYGESKLAGEWLVRAASSSLGFRSVSLRYFNVAGAGWPELHDSAPLNLLTIAIHAIANGEQPQIFGDDYPTPDGTGVRDYVHVLDLAAAHLACLDTMVQPGRNRVYNVGTGQGVSVRQILDELARVSGHAIPGHVVGRRAGDPASVVADARRINREIGWSAKQTITGMVESAWKAHF